jgi:hypothetical protein
MFGIACLATLAGLIGLLQVGAYQGDLVPVGGKKDNKHYNGHDAIKNKLNTPGKHEIPSPTNTHTTHAHVNNGKVARVEVNHKTKGPVNVAKYKSAKKFHAQAEGTQHHYVSIESTELTEAGGAQPAVIAFVGFGFFDDSGVLHIIWFPVTIVLNGDAGAVDYNP